jgi:hypothetical protein
VAPNRPQRRGYSAAVVVVEGFGAPADPDGDAAEADGAGSVVDFSLVAEDDSVLPLLPEPLALLAVPERLSVL